METTQEYESDRNLEDYSQAFRRLYQKIFVDKFNHAHARHHNGFEKI